MVENPSAGQFEPPRDSFERDKTRRRQWWQAAIALVLLIYQLVEGGGVLHRAAPWLSLLLALGALAAVIVDWVLFRRQLDDRPDGPFSPCGHLTR